MARDGWIKLHRKILDSDIFLWKPAEWLKIWLYILLKVNHDDGNLPRGTGYFRTPWKNIVDEKSESKITKWQWHHCIQFLKNNNMIATQKTTRGSIVRVLHYSIYQDRDKIKSNTESNTQATHKQHYIKRM